MSHQICLQHLKTDQMWHSTEKEADMKGTSIKNKTLEKTSMYCTICELIWAPRLYTILSLQAWILCVHWGISQMKFVWQQNSQRHFINCSMLPTVLIGQANKSTKMHSVRPVASFHFKTVALYFCQRWKQESIVVPYIVGWQISVTSLLDFWIDWYDTGFNFLLTNRLNQDCLRNHFSTITVQRWFQR